MYSYPLPSSLSEEPDVSRLGRMAVLAAGILLAGCAASDSGGPAAREPSWPAEDASAWEWLFTTQQNGDAKATFLISPVVSLRDGTLIRLATLTFVGETGLCYAELLLDDTERFGGGSGSRLVFASPRPGLTWGEVAEDEDVVIDIRIDG